MEEPRLAFFGLFNTIFCHLCVGMLLSPSLHLVFYFIPLLFSFLIWRKLEANDASVQIPHLHVIRYKKNILIIYTKETGRAQRADS